MADVALQRLESVLGEAGNALIAFSGGVDSGLVLQVAHRVLGDKAVALTADSPTFPKEEKEQAIAFAEKLGVRHLVVDAHELEREGYAANDGRRCYFCKTELFELARLWADRVGIRWVMDGTITDDLGDHRPGLEAAEEHRVRHPLVEAGFDKSAVRDTAHSLGLDLWDKPSFACLGSRFPEGTRVTTERVEKVGRIESVLRIYGFRHFRVRFHELDEGPLARIELAPSDFAALISEGVRDAVLEACWQEGFRQVTLDLAGYRSGGLPTE